MSTSDLPRDHEARMDRARLSLAGLSVGDAFGERFFAQGEPGCGPADEGGGESGEPLALCGHRVRDSHGRVVSGGDRTGDHHA
jgi:hypothetical protein